MSTSQATSRTGSSPMVTWRQLIIIALVLIAIGFVWGMIAPNQAAAQAPLLQITQNVEVKRVISANRFVARVYGTREVIRLAWAHSDPQDHVAEQIVEQFLTKPRRLHVALLVFGRNPHGELVADVLRYAPTFSGTPLSVVLRKANSASVTVPVASQTLPLS